MTRFHNNKAEAINVNNLETSSEKLYQSTTNS